MKEYISKIVFLEIYHVQVSGHEYSQTTETGKARMFYIGLVLLGYSVGIYASELTNSCIEILELIDKRRCMIIGS